MNKTRLFEYITYHLIEWYKEEVSKDESNIAKNFSRLRTLKLLFFVSTIKDNENDNKDLLDVFNRFYAMQYGPVEADIYTNIVKDETEKYNFGIRSLTIKNKNTDIFNDLYGQGTADRSIQLLKKRNPEIISYPASKLINISHKWDTWKGAYSVAGLLDKGSELMPTALIRKDKQYYE